MIRMAGLPTLAALKDTIQRRAAALARRGIIIAVAGIAAILFGFAAIACAVAALLIAVMPEVGPIGAWLIGAATFLILGGVCILAVRAAAGTRDVDPSASDFSQDPAPEFEPRRFEITGPVLFTAFAAGILATLAGFLGAAGDAGGQDDPHLRPFAAHPLGEGRTR